MKSVNNDIFYNENVSEVDFKRFLRFKFLIGVFFLYIKKLGF